MSETNAPLPDLDNLDDQQAALPWWRSKANLLSLLVCAAVLSAAAGFVVGERNATPSGNAVDVGFLQDMRTHHDQAIQMSLVYLSKPDTSSGLTSVAKDIVYGQGIEVGRMIQLLTNFGESQINETGIAMGWMNEPIADDRMPGMASLSDRQALLGATGGVEADEIFAALMIAHHQGGIHMADYAAAHGDFEEVRILAANMSSGQRHEIDDMNKVLATG